MTTFLLVIYWLCQVLTIAIICTAVLSWIVMASPRNRTVINLYLVFRQITNPILAPLRRIIPLIGAIDITPIVAFIILQIIAQVIIAYM
jgi:YggT family protein